MTGTLRVADGATRSAVLALFEVCRSSSLRVEGGDLVTDDTKTSGSTSHRTTWISALAFGAVITAHALGVWGGATYPAVIGGGIVCAFIGLRRHQPTLRWPWLAMVAAALLWAVAGIVRAATDATGDLTANRSLIPDLFALPGYVMWGLALYGLMRARRAPDDYGAQLDGIMLGAAALLFVNELLILPTLRIDGAWLMARIAIAIYPAISMCLLVLAARLAFSSGPRSLAFTLLLGGMASLLIGDVVFALGDAGWIVVNERLLEVHICSSPRRWEWPCRCHRCTSAPGPHIGPPALSVAVGSLR